MTPYMAAQRTNPSKGLPPATDKVGTSTAQSSEEVTKQQIEWLSKTLEPYRKSDSSLYADNSMSRRTNDQPSKRTYEIETRQDATIEPNTIPMIPALLPKSIPFVYTHFPESIHPLIKGSYAKLLFDRNSSMSCWLYGLLTGKNVQPYSSVPIRLTNTDYTFTLTFTIIPNEKGFDENERRLKEINDPFLIIGEDILNNVYFHSLTAHHLIFKNQQILSKLVKLPITRVSFEEILQWMDQNFINGPNDPLKPKKQEPKRHCKCQKNKNESLLM